MHATSGTAVRTNVPAARPSNVVRGPVSSRRSADSILYTPVTDTSLLTEAFFHRTRACSRPASGLAVAAPTPTVTTSRLTCDAFASPSFAPTALTWAYDDPMASDDSTSDFDVMDVMETLCICSYDEEDDAPLPASFYLSPLCATPAAAPATRPSSSSA